ncbi:MAG: DNA internalization-related competence protein ComEC/Rec2 [Faecousia sp.]
MRKLLWIVVGFSGACALLAYGREHLWMLTAAMVLVSIALGILLICRKRDLLRPGIAVLAGLLLGLAWFEGYRHLYLQPLAALDGELASLSITASDYGDDNGMRTAVDGVAAIAGKPYQIRAYINEETTVFPGDTLEGTFRLRITTGQESASAYFQGKGIFLLAYQQEEIRITPGEKVPAWCCPAVLRQRILSLLGELFPEDTAPFAKALLLGDTRDLDYETDTALKISGIRHIVAVSGLHISILYGFLCTLTRKRRFLTPLVGLPALLLFAAVAGFTPSVLRSSLMVGLMMLAMIFDREYDSATALSFAVLTMLLVNPLAVMSVSLQLSVGCVTGILLFREPIFRWLYDRISGKRGMAARLRGMVCNSLSVTISAMSLITPLSACLFGTVSLVSPLTNLLTLWVVTIIFIGLVITCLAYLVMPAAAVFLAGLLSWPVRYVLALARGLASMPLAAVYTESIYIVFWLIFVYVLLAVFLGMERKQPGILLCCGVLGLCLALTASWLEPLTADTRITMLDVGQGQSILLQTEGKTFLVDCGGDSEEKTADLIAQTLLSQGIHRLDGLILTHYDRDHSGGLHHLLTRVDTDYLFLPDIQNEMPVPKTTGEILYVWEDLELSVGDAALQIYGPVYSGPGNENSLCVLFDTENCDILITGDRSAFGERMLMRTRDLPDVDILVAGHHGAADAVSEELLQQVRPETVLISVGQDNLYGHPSPALLHRLEEFGCTVCRTDEQGTITIRR